MKKQFVTLAVATLLAGTAFAQANDTLAKVKASILPYICGNLGV